MNEVKELTLDSREVAKMLPKVHAHLLRDIDTYNRYFSQNPKLAFDDFWHESIYQAGTGKRYKCYKITKKGCEFLAHKMTGKKGALFTAAYINRFHEMEEELKEIGTGELPLVELERLHYNGKVFMTTIMLAKMTGISNSYIAHQIKVMGLPHILLAGEALKEFKRENRIRNSSSRMLLLGTETVNNLLRSFSIYKKYHAVVSRYFTEEKSSYKKGVVVDVPENGKIQAWIIRIRATLQATMDTLELYNGYNRPDDHTAINTSLEALAADVFSQVVALKEFEVSVTDKRCLG